MPQEPRASDNLLFPPPQGAEQQYFPAFRPKVIENRHPALWKFPPPQWVEQQYFPGLNSPPFDAYLKCALKRDAEGMLLSIEAIESDRQLALYATEFALAAIENDLMPVTLKIIRMAKDCVNWARLMSCAIIKLHSAPAFHLLRQEYAAYYRGPPQKHGDESPTEKGIQGAMDAAMENNDCLAMRICLRLPCAQSPRYLTLPPDACSADMLWLLANNRAIFSHHIVCACEQITRAIDIGTCPATSRAMYLTL